MVRGWYAHGMKTTIDRAGRIVVPKALRDRLGFSAGTEIDVSAYGDGLFVVPERRTARLERDEAGRLVATSETPVDDDIVFGVLDDLRR